jgi:hypothetical protein
MSGLWIQNRVNGVARIEPRLAMVDGFDRLLFVLPVMFTAFGFFMAGAMPVEVLLGISLSCVVGDVLIWLRYVVSSHVRPVASVTRLVATRAR